ncbi:MAG: CoA-binding protein [Spirochaetes bacterium]|nr:CoA-binding protein [Spirochaetota bacterium]
MTIINSDIDFHSLFYPRNIVFIGASPVPGKWGFVIPANIIRGNYEGRFYPVNPNYSTLFGMPCYPSLSAIQGEVDLVVVTVPANHVPAIIDECISKRVKSIVVITSDFSETGSEGALLEKEIASKTKAHGINLVGPNTMGIFNAYGRLNILMPYIKADPGHVSIVSQSGNVGTQIMGECSKNGIGISKVISSGNEANIKCEDYISYLAEDDTTKIIALYIESFKDGQKILNICRKLKAVKPIIVYKSGKTHGGKLAAASHTGAMAGSIEIYRSVFKQCGIIEADSTEEMIDIIGGFLALPLPRGNRVGILTIGGGWGVIAADECETHGFILPQLSDDIFNKLNEFLPKYWSRRNPVDMAAFLSMDAFPKAMESMASWDGVDSVLSLGSGVSTYNFFDYTDLIDKFGLKKEEVEFVLQKISAYMQKRGESLSKLMNKYNKPVLHVESGGEDDAYRNMREYNHVVFRSPERAVKVLKKMYDFYKIRERMNKA